MPHGMICPVCRLDLSRKFWSDAQWEDNYPHGNPYTLGRNCCKNCQDYVGTYYHALVEDAPTSQDSATADEWAALVAKGLHWDPVSQCQVEYF